jgi:protease IV
MAKLKTYTLYSYPEQKSIFGKLGNNMSEQVKTHYMKSELGENYIYYQQIKNLTQMMRTPQMRMPYDIAIH